MKHIVHLEQCREFDVICDREYLFHDLVWSISLRAELSGSCFDW